MSEAQPAGAPAQADWPGLMVAALVADGELTIEQGAFALARAKTNAIPVGELLACEGLVDARKSLRFLSAISGLEVCDLASHSPEELVNPGYAEAIARRHRAIGLRAGDKAQLLVCAEPLRAEVIGAIAKENGREVTKCMLAESSDIERFVAKGKSLSPGRDRAEPPADISDRANFARCPSPQAKARGEALEGRESATKFNTEAKSQGLRAPLPDSRTGSISHTPSMNELLLHAVASGASDLHLAHDLPPSVRVDGAIRHIDGLAPLDKETVRELVYSILPQSARERFEAKKELDTSHSIHGVGRFRVSVFQQRGNVGAVLRLIPSDIPEFSTLGLPSSLETLAEFRRGLVLVTGPTGSGKSTTLASIIGLINKTKPFHIMTVEDPIEFVHKSAQAIVNQREVGLDTESFAESLRHVLRQDPDVILVGEMRDLETISMALTAAETGHLVFSTLHTQDAPQTLDRVIDVFPTAQQAQVRAQLASALQAVVTQQLLLGADGHGRVPIAEVMFCTPAVRNLIRTGKSHQLYSLMQTGAEFGMQTMDQALALAVRSGAITQDMALERCRDRDELIDNLRA